MIMMMMMIFVCCWLFVVVVVVGSRSQCKCINRCSKIIIMFYSKISNK